MSKQRPKWVRVRLSSLLGGEQWKAAWCGFNLSVLLTNINGTSRWEVNMNYNGDQCHARGFVTGTAPSLNKAIDAAEDRSIRLLKGIGR